MSQGLEQWRTSTQWGGPIYNQSSWTLHTPLQLCKIIVATRRTLHNLAFNHATEYSFWMASTSVFDIKGPR